MRTFLFLFLLPGFLLAQKEKSRTVFTDARTYDQVIAEFTALDKKSEICTMSTSGMTDIGKPLHVFVMSSDKTFLPGAAKSKGKCVIMINNAIHPGEPDGVEASLEMAKVYVADPSKLPANVVLVIIPVYNIDGYISPGGSRVNQNGPETHGFRANAKNLDLNRDFIKADAQNTLSLEQIFQLWKPDVFIDNHVSDGADYQYTMTLIATQRSKLHPLLSEYMDKKLVPAIYSGMKVLDSPICPYVETMGETPESGIVGFLETPRFATGYAALFNCIGFVPETHMLKPYNDRVWATYDLMIIMINRCSQDASEIVRLHKEADEAVKVQTSFALGWELDTTKYDMIDFNGYEATHVISKVSGLPVLYYDRTKPYTKQIRFYNTYTPKVVVQKPTALIIPQAWTAVIQRLQVNGVKMKRLIRDEWITADRLYIDHVQSPQYPYEGHYNHRGTTVRSKQMTALYHTGDYVIELNQVSNRYIMETLDPRGDDSFFAWNFFDPILNQKEWFSDYVFDPKAEEVLRDRPDIQAQLDSARKADSTLAKSHWLQMNFIYQRSDYKEQTHMLYPVGWLSSLDNVPFDK